MGATNSTTYYNLSQFIATDKPAWLQDYNGDMVKIDTAINGAKVAADAAQLAADAAQSDATTALGSIETVSDDVSTIQTTLGTAVGNINTINSLIGNGTPTTTDQTIIGAINEINDNVQDLLPVATNNLSVVNGDSIATHPFIIATFTISDTNTVTRNNITASPDGTKTINDLIDEAVSNLISLIASAPATSVIHITSIQYNTWSTGQAVVNYVQGGTNYSKGSFTGNLSFDFEFSSGDYRYYAHTIARIDYINSKFDYHALEIRWRRAI